ncbi:MAG: hypothetical protein DA328_09645, partial [Nitrososphaeraceae archaeon]|nr:hypothetical protein [Nitrososphaeraceae archaeon]
MGAHKFLKHNKAIQTIKKMKAIVFDTVKKKLLVLLILYCLYHFINENDDDIAFADSLSPKTISIMAVGDSIGYNVDEKDLTNLDKIIQNNTDIFIFNLEGVLSKNPFPLNNINMLKECHGFPKYQSTFVTDYTFVDYLKLAPITIANLANNHIFDCDINGIKETKKILMEKDILSVGAGQNLKEACEPLIIQSEEGLRIMFVSYNFVLKKLVSAQTNHAGGASIEGCKHDYNKMKLQNKADIIIASIHLGYWSSHVSARQIDVVQHLFDSGVDIVIGHSPHIPQAIQKTKTIEGEKLAFFSLGNFILKPDYVMPLEAHTTIVPKITIDTENNIMNVTIYSV